MVDITDNVKRAGIADYLEGLIGINTSVDEMRRLAEQVHGASQRFAVPIYETKTGRWINYSGGLCDPERSYTEAVGRLTKLS